MACLREREKRPHSPRPAGTAQALDAESKLLATLKLPLRRLVPHGTATIRVSPADYDRMLLALKPQRERHGEPSGKHRMSGGQPGRQNPATGLT